MSGLYGGLPSARDASEEAAKAEKKEGWAGSGLFAPATLAAKRAAALVPPAALRTGGGRGRGREGPAPVAPGRGSSGGRGRGGAAGKVSDGGSMLLAAASSNDGPITVTATAVPAVMPGMSLGEDIKEEYDPAKPNDYDAVRRAREQQRREAELEAERQERLRAEREAAEARAREQEERMREMQELEALELQREEEIGGGAAAGGAAQPPAFAAAQQQQGEEQRRAALQLSGDEAWKRRGMWTAGPDSGGGAGLGSGGGGLGFGGAGSGMVPPGGPKAGPKGMSLAQKLLEKMGWKEGEGLGRNRQGMATPLMMQKTDVRTGVIVSAAPPAGTSAPEQQPAKRQRAASFNRPPTKVVLLTNMIGPGEVDKDLDREVGEECSKYGTVTNVMIFEVMEPGFPADQAVRIFVEFDRVEEATKALIDLQGRFFGGREVEASFFEEERFAKRELAPLASEVRR
ncbi:hypothetical protein ABPG75_001748 [Micractinium tetrahymenae]